TLVQQVEEVPFEFTLGNTVLVPLRAGETIAWSLAK
ncbi:MAG: hypothetical protein RIR08_852, partial [Pseudomonadota bacterium]